MVLYYGSLLWLGITRDPKGFGGPTYDTTYDLASACLKCGTGAIQTSSLILKRSEIPPKGDIFRSFDGDILISEKLSGVIKENRVSGIELRKTLSHKDEMALPWLQINAQKEMPPMASTTTGIIRENPCNECNRDGYFHASFEPILIHYDIDYEFLRALPDVVHTYERFGNSVLRDGPRKSDSRIRCKIRQTTRRSHRDEQDKEEEVCSRV
jgi:hypothetical protein